MPSADAILNGLAAIANDFRGLAVGWHAALVVLAGMLVGGWTPSVRTARSLFVAPLASVGIVAWLAGNPFNGTLFLGLTATLVGSVSGGSSAPVRYDSPAWMTRGAALVVFGATYPHFLRAESPADYLFASPFGLLPCPTLSVVIGLTLLFVNLGSTLWSTALVAAGLLYGVIGVFRLGVDLDWGLFIGTAMLGARLLSDRAIWRSVRAHRSERTRPLPGDDLIPEPLGTLTHAITIHRGAPAVWPWLVQMGAGRAGWYSYDALDNGRQPSATRVVPELQSVAIDALFPALPGVTAGFKVLDVQPRRVLVLGWPAPGGAAAVTWAFVLEDRAGHATRLIVRVRGAHGYRFHGLPSWLSFPVVSVVHFLMQRRQLLGIARRAESADAAPAPEPMPEPEGHRV